MKVSITGHRPNKLGGYSDEVFNRLVALYEQELPKLKTSIVYNGMALGADQAAATACVNLSIPFIAAVPFKNQECKWPEKSKLLYRQLLTYAKEVIIVCEGEYAAWKMQKRNEFMVDKADIVLGLWDGTNGGTWNCINYAQSQGKKVVNIWQEWDKKFKWL